MIQRIELQMLIPLMKDNLLHNIFHLKSSNTGKQVVWTEKGYNK